MHDRIDTPMPLVGQPPPELKGFGRDLRIDFCRGIALWFIFLDHVPNNIGSWLTLRNYGFSDSAEAFVFISGVTCALAYGRACRCEGWSAVISLSLRRSWDIYAAFLLLTLACAIMVYLAGRDHLADASNTRILLEHPGATLAHAAILQYRPVNTDVLPIFVVYHLLFAPLLWLLLRVPNATLGSGVNPTELSSHPSGSRSSIAAKAAASFTEASGSPTVASTSSVDLRHGNCSSITEPPYTAISPSVFRSRR
jgi:hypothetical protein